MSDLPIVHFPATFNDDFQYRGPTRLPGAATIPDHWTVTSGAWTTSSERHLACTEVGRLTYSGDSLISLDENFSSGYAFKVWFRGQDDLKCVLWTNLSTDGTDRVTLTIDFRANTISLALVNAPVSTEIRGISHTLTDGAYYLLEGWYFDNGLVDNQIRYVTLLNGAILMDENFLIEDELDEGFALEVERLPTSETAIFNAFRVYELTEEIDPEPITDASDLVLFHRTELQRSIEDPPAKTWETFKAAYKHWKGHKDFGRSDETWTHAGYAVRRPMTEDWFV